jgi:galacturan 1,4-alpha-galacturonidase
VYNSTNVSYDNIHINTHSYSKNPPSNSDGWDIYRSDHVSITNSVINNCWFHASHPLHASTDARPDDDCVSFKPTTTVCTSQRRVAPAR